MATVLLIEDDLLLADCYIRWLAADGLKVQHVTSAQDALDVLDDALPAVIVLDMLLPGANGIQILHELRSYADTANMPTIVCSNAVQAGDADLLLAYGVRSVLDKSTLTRSKLRQAINGAMQ